MCPSLSSPGRPDYDFYSDMAQTRSGHAERFARQILATCAPFLIRQVDQLEVLDIGCGYGDTAIELAKKCRRVVGIEPSPFIFARASQRLDASGLANIEIRHQSIYDLKGEEQFDLIVLDNVFEHLPDQPAALQIISQCLKPGAVAFLLMPNKLWPIEVHYRLPFL